MVGNDIVDLKRAALESNWQRKGFLNKVFTPSEKQYIQDAENPFQMVWLLWSMKESAYKIYMQEHQNRFFNPKKMACTLLKDSLGVVKINNASYRTFSTINSAFIYTIAVLKNTDKIESQSFEINDSGYLIQHQTCKSKVIEVLSKKHHVKKEAITISKSELGIPKLYKSSKILGMACSITHHGNYGAYAMSAC
jgi:phosphopantetheinyl transferase (holo-ACP synthase)